MNIRSIFANTDWLDWLLAIGFTALLTFIGWLIQDQYGWFLGLIIAPVLLGLAKSRRDQARNAAEQAAAAQEDPPAK
ncbi:MAG: hypothetical protein VB013_05215 [Anaerolineaceae bacterium]|nr:hypothetical protein [Anaerolineaceae bacterium]